MTTLATRLAYPNLSKVFLAEVTGGKPVRFWTKTGGLTSTYEYATTLRVTSVYENGVALTSRASSALVDANAASYYWDQAGGKLYVHATGSVSPYAKTMVAMVKFLFSTKGRVLDGKWYDPRISSLPTSSVRVESQFGDPGQVGGGKIEFRNNDGFFDELTDIRWDAGEIKILMGADNPLVT